MMNFRARMKEQSPVCLPHWKRTLGTTVLLLSLSAGANAADRQDISAQAVTDPKGVVLSVQTPFAPIEKQDENDERGHVRLTVYDSKENFLEKPFLKSTAPVNERGEAVLSLGPLPEGEYAFVAYYDKNGDRKLNRSFIGRPKEPFAFSNGVRPKLRKPKFKRTKVNVVPGDVIVIRIKD